MNLSSTIERTLSPTLRAASVRVSRQFSAAPERLFAAWLNACEARRFLFEDRVGDTITSSEIDARVGGEFRILRHRDGGEVEYSGEFLEIEPPHRLVFSLFVEKYAQRDDRVIVEIAPVAEGSLLVLTHELSLPNPAERLRVQHAWVRALKRLGACTASTMKSRGSPAVTPPIEWTSLFASS